MEILIIEDQDDKFAVLQSEISSSFSEVAIKLERSRSLAAATKQIYEKKFDLIVIDLMMPLRDVDPLPQDISEDIISILELSASNRDTNIISLSGYEDLVSSQRQRFTESGIILVHYDGAGGRWKKYIRSALSKIREQVIFDFVIICALEKERSAYRSTSAKIGELRNIRGLDCMSLDLGLLKGACVKLPRMGLVEASIVTTRAIDIFKPRLVTMSGICAGMSGNANLGTLIVPDICWEYQAGKWADSGFKIEHYDVALQPTVRTTLDQLIAQDVKGSKYKEGLLEDPIRFESIVIAPMSTGSAVIASEDRMEEVSTQHRKMAGVEMEMYGVYKAAELSARNLMFFGAKTVVDLANSAKGDIYHEYGSILSARFVLDGILKLLEEQ